MTNAIGSQAVAIFEAMREVVEAPGYPYLNHYKVDFYKYDFDHIMRTYTTGVRYLWVVRDCGTHLLNLGVHAKMTEEIKAVFSLFSECAIYIVDKDKVKEITLEHAKFEIERSDYQLKNGVVYSRGTILATLKVKMLPQRYCQEREYGVDYSSMARYLTAKDLLALLQIARCEVVEKAQTFFAKSGPVTLDGHDLHDLFVSTNALDKPVLDLHQLQSPLAIAA